MFANMVQSWPRDYYKCFRSIRKMKILYLASSADFHVDLWVKYFTKKNKVYLFSDAQNYLKDQCFENVEVIKSNGYFGKILNKFKLKNKKPFQINKLVSVKYFAFIIDNIITTTHTGVHIYP